MNLYRDIMDESAPKEGLSLAEAALTDCQTVWQLESSADFAIKVKQGRVAVFLCEKASALTLERLGECCAPFGVGEALECNEFQYILAIGLLADSELLTLGSDSGVAVSKVDFSPTVDDIRGIAANISDYYYGYEDRYRAVYDNGARLWESAEPNDSLRNMMSDHPEIFAGKIIDLGCGEGRDSLYLLSQGHDVVSVDVSHTALSRARELAAAANLETSGFMERDIIYLRGFDADHFDLAMNMGCLHMLVEDEQRASHISRVFAIVRPGGYFVVDHCSDEWGKGFFSIPDYEQVAADLVPGRVIPRRIRVSDGEKNIGLEVLPFAERSPDALTQEITRSGFTLVDGMKTETEAFGSSTILLFQKPA
jgi:SAM-dependent methyltransferase